MFEQDLKETQKNFNLIRADVEQVLKSNILDVEGQGNLELMLDRYAGIDYIAMSKYGLRGVASRIQKGKSWRTFTIRESKASGNKTEKEKRQFAIDKDFIYPYYTIQAYVEQDKIEYAICRTKELYKFIDDNPQKIRRNKTTNAIFVIVNWRDIENIITRTVRI